VKSEEAFILLSVGNGASTFEEMHFRIPVENVNLDKILEELVCRSLVTVNLSGFQLSKIGLLELSRFLYGEKCKRTEYLYSFNDDLPYLLYKNNYRKDTIFHPELIFDPASNFEDWNTQIVYEIVFHEYKFDLDLIEVIYNLLFEYKHLHPTGFWVLGTPEKSLYGHGIPSLRRTIGIVKNPISLVFAIAFQDFIILAKSVKGNVEGDIRIKIYLTRDTFPYIDTLDFLTETLKPLWLFLGVKDIPKGREIKVGPKDPERFLPKPVYFVPKIIGKIVWKDKTTRPYELDPFIIAFDSSEIDVPLSKVSPWLASCAGGFLDEDFKEKRKFHVLHRNILCLPDINIVGINLSPVYSR